MKRKNLKFNEYFFSVSFSLSFDGLASFDDEFFFEIVSNSFVEFLIKNFVVRKNVKEMRLGMS